MKSAFAEVLGKLRRKKGLSQRQAATDLGISQALLSHYENDAREPKLDFVIKACDYYDVSADYMLGRSDECSQKMLQLMDAVSDTANALEEIKKAESELISNLKQLTSTYNRG